VPLVLPGTNHAALRYWMRSIREGAYMVLSYAAQGVGAPLWLNQRLAAALPQVRRVDARARACRAVLGGGRGVGASRKACGRGW
jgi:hypothetical protein